VLRLLLLLALAAGAISGVAAADYPNKSIRFISPFLPGGSQDVIARIVGSKLAERVGQQVVVDNRSGAAGIIAAELTAKAPPDGYTILMVTAGPITIAPNLNRKMSFDPLRDLAPVSQLVETPMALVASPSFAAKSVGEAIALARTRAGQINYASVGSGSISHLTMELFKTHTGTDMTHVPYKGAVPAFTDLVGGQVSLLFITTASAQPFVASGKVRMLAVAAKKRSGMMPDVPTMNEAGVKDFEVPVWAGVSTTGGTPAAVIEKLYREMHAVLQLPDIRERLAQLGSEVVGSTPAQFAGLLKNDLARWGKVVKTAHVQVD
jgi:tripartite-type tricarboxylate transporter receptor subunit TctC